MRDKSILVNQGSWKKYNISDGRGNNTVFCPKYKIYIKINYNALIFYLYLTFLISSQIIKYLRNAQLLKEQSEIGAGKMYGVIGLSDAVLILKDQKNQEDASRGPR